MPPRTPAATTPVARVLPLLRIAHLDRGFDYLVSQEDSEAAVPGVRVRIRFNGQLQDAIVLQRLDRSDFSGDLRFIERVVSPFVVYPPALSQLVESLSARYAGTRADIIRAAIPPRHAKAEEADFGTAWEDLGTATEPDLSGWQDYQHGASFVDAVLSGTVARAAWQVAAGKQWMEALAALAAKVAIDGGGVVIVVPDQRDVDRLEAQLRTVVGAKQITTLTNSLGPQARYRRYLMALQGQARIVIGTRSAAYAPVQNLRLVAIYDDGDSSLVDNTKPYVHAREVLTTRAAQEGASVLIVGHSRTAETQLLVESGWAHNLLPTVETLQRTCPGITAVGEYGVSVARERGGTTSLQGPAYHALSAALGRGEPVLVSVPRAGYMPLLACGKCRTPARCRACNGPLGLPVEAPDDAPVTARAASAASAASAQVPACRWCGQLAPAHRCSACGSPRIRALVLGVQATAEELGRAFARTAVVVSGGNRVVDTVAAEPALVIATPGAEPQVSAGLYGAALIMDTGAVLGRQDLRATEEALASWARVATLVAPRSEGGEVIIAAEPGLPVVQELCNWNFAGAAARELASRRELRFPPAVPVAAIDGAAAAVDSFLSRFELADSAEVLGPVPLPPGNPLPGDYDVQQFGPPQRVIVRTPPGPRAALGLALRTAQAQRSINKEDLPLRIQVDPLHFG
ncbi:primosomal protein N' [Corynebacterium lizhenjunii]|uniref:Probable replication restart protein PriA n=1 Tax=Corynebacterium lizhenjunii TaxID=2709394 RepID=A0A7T0PAB4_9CORY|nr:primosomal protein N' [Corynebacterium lizhenjunii]QPK78195.1 primosomal protein N' [Corynebacterium lizhenjunii]